MDTEFVLTIVFVGLGILLAIFLGLRVHRQMRILAQKANDELKAQGYVVDNAYLRPIGELTRIWARYPHPISLYVQASNIDPVAIAAGHLGVASLKVGHMEFDSNFVVRSNAPELVSQVFDEEVRAELLKYENIRFRTGSLTNLLGADYFPEQREGRDLRDFWMIEKSGKLSAEECKKLLALGRNISMKAERIGRIPGIGLEATFFEGR